MNDTPPATGVATDNGTPAAAATTIANPFQQLLAAELALFMPVLDQFFVALQQPGVNTQAVAQDAAKSLLQAAMAAPQAETIGINNIAANAQSQLHALVAKASSQTPAAAVTGAASTNAGE